MHGKALCIDVGPNPVSTLLLALCHLSRILLFPHPKSGYFTHDHYRVDEIPEKSESFDKQGHTAGSRVYHRRADPVLLWEAWERNSGIRLKNSAQCTKGLPMVGLGSAEVKFSQ